MTSKLLETLISAAIGAATSIAVAYLQVRLNRRWNSPNHQVAQTKTEE